MRTTETKSRPSMLQKKRETFFQKKGGHNFFNSRPVNTSSFFASGKNISQKIQPQLTVGQPNDKYENEADAMADKVVRRLAVPGVLTKNENSVQTKPLANGVTPLIQMKCAACEREEKLQKNGEEDLVDKSPMGLQRKPDQSTNRIQTHSTGFVQRKCSACEKEEKALEKAGDGVEPLEYYGAKTLGMLQRQEDERSALRNNTKDGAASETNHFDSALGSEMRTGGKTMAPGIQTSMQNAFGSDFTGVKIHDDSTAHALSNQIQAKAFTHRNHIFFNKNEYNPGSRSGQSLLAHELTHTIQQGAGKPSAIQRRIGDGHDFPVTSRFSGNVQLENVFDNQRTVQSGNSGPHVTLIQQALIALNYPLPTFGADGTFGDETERAVRAFQSDVGLGVDGIVGFRTIDLLDRRDRNAEIRPPVGPVVANTPFNVNNAFVRPGATPSIALTGCNYGLTFPENVQIRIDLINNAGVWQPVLREVVGNYSLQFRLVAGQAEVTGPAGNTNAANYCAQITELDRLGNCPGGAPPAQWYMLAAVLEHERVHATRFRNALIHPTVITPLETAIEGVTVPAAGLTSNQFVAELFIRANPAFGAALNAAQANWLARILVLVANDHAAGGPTSVAEHRIVDPMVRRICRHARANGWPACPPLCP